MDFGGGEQGGLFSASDQMISPSKLQANQV